MSDELLSPNQAAAILSVHPNTVRNWVGTGYLKQASLPGESRIKIRRSEVQRLVAARAEAIGSSTTALRSIGPDLIDANDLAWWTGRVAEEKLPELVRRLAAASAGVTELSARAGDGISAPGWDGQLVSDGSSPFLPTGVVKMEFGTNDDVVRKAQSDYENRVKAKVSDSADSHFVFVTSRRWRTSESWVRARSAEGNFASVRVLDADDLEAWLQHNEPVHVWVSEVLGRRPREVETLDHWWRAFSTNTEPALTKDLFTLGRDEAVAAVVAYVAGAHENAPLVVQASWTDEAIAFLYAVLSADPTTSTPVLIKTEAAWVRLLPASSPSVVIPTFDHPDLGLARAHTVLLVGGADMGSRQGATSVELSKVPRRDASAALQSLGFPSHRAEKLAALYRRSAKAFVRTISLDPRLVNPLLAMSSQDRSTVAALSLVTQWTDSVGDRAALERLARREWSEIEALLLLVSQTDDPVFTKGDGGWRLASPVEATLLFHPLATSADVAAWRDLVLDVLLETDPQYGLSETDRFVAQIKGRHRVTTSVLFEGVAHGVAYLATSNAVIAGAGGQSLADSIVAELFDRVSDSEDVLRAWVKLAPAFDKLAEASPDVFLDRVLIDLSSDKSELAHLLPKASEGTDIFSPTSGHVYLVWALERLAAAAEHFPAAAAALAILSTHETDANIRGGNSPFNSLSNVLTLWLRYTAANVDTKFAVLAQTLADTPEVGWRLALALLPDSHGISVAPSRPQFRDWAPEDMRVTRTSLLEQIERLGRVVFDAAGERPERWAEVVPHLDDLPPRELDRYIQRLSELVIRPDFSSNAASLWGALDTEIRRHSEFADADWAYSAERLSQLHQILALLPAPNPWASHLYLFSWSPNLEGIESDHSVAYYEEVSRRQMDAVVLMTEDSVDGLAAAANDVDDQRPLGFAAGRVLGADFDTEILGWLVSDDFVLSAVARGFVEGRIVNNGVAWLMKTLGSSDLTDFATRVALSLVGPGTEDYWDALAASDAELAHAYWGRMSPWGIADASLRRGFDELMAAGRASDALIPVSIRELRSEAPDVFTPADLMDALIAFLKEDHKGRLGSDVSHRVARALDLLAEASYDLQAVATLEYSFLPLLSHTSHVPTALWTVLRESPAEFVGLVQTVVGKGAKDPNGSDRGHANMARTALNSWDHLPGGDGSWQDANANLLLDWVRQARSLLAEAELADVGDEMLGNVLARGAQSAPDNWPSEAVRNVIETVRSTDLESGFFRGILNSRGVTSRDPYDGGTQERALATRFRKLSGESFRWSRTARILRRVAESYERDARREDGEANWLGDDG